MHWSPDVLTAMTLRGRRPYDEKKTQSQPPQRPTPPRTVRAAAPDEPGPPEHGCVDWFVYDEEPAAEDRVV